DVSGVGSVAEVIGVDPRSLAGRRYAARAWVVGAGVSEQNAAPALQESSIPCARTDGRHPTAGGVVTPRGGPAQAGTATVAATGRCRLVAPAGAAPAGRTTAVEPRTTSSGRNRYSECGAACTLISS